VQHKFASKIILITYPSTIFSNSTAHNSSFSAAQFLNSQQDTAKTLAVPTIVIIKMETTHNHTSQTFISVNSFLKQDSIDICSVVPTVNKRQIFTQIVQEIHNTTDF
jgi:hypothetical protein